MHGFTDRQHAVFADGYPAFHFPAPAALGALADIDLAERLGLTPPIMKIGQDSLTQTESKVACQPHDRHRSSGSP